MEKKSFSFELKASRGKREIEGYAASYEKDLVNDVIQKGAFTKTIAERMPKNQIKILWQHDRNQPIGKPIHMEEDSKGLFIVGRLTAGVKAADEALELINDGIVDTMSIGYDVIKDEFADDKSTRFLKELRLYEFSPVTFPANPAAAITASRKDIGEMLEEFDGEKMYNLVKAGRVLNKQNIEAIETAIKSLQAVLDIANGRADGKSLERIAEPKDPFTQLLAEMQEYTKNFKK